MPWRQSWEQVWQALRGQRPMAARSAAFVLIILLTVLMVLAQFLELSVAPLLVLACFLMVAVLTGGLIVFTFAHHSGQG